MERTANCMRNSGWSADVCSPDLARSSESMSRCSRVQNDQTRLEGCAHSQRAGEGQWRLRENPALALAFGAIKGLSPALDEADDRAAASARHARAAIDAPVLREIAEVAFGAEEIAQGRAARGDRRRQDRKSVV